MQRGSEAGAPDNPGRRRPRQAGSRGGTGLRRETVAACCPTSFFLLDFASPGSVSRVDDRRSVSPCAARRIDCRAPSRDHACVHSSCNRIVNLLTMLSRVHPLSSARRRAPVLSAHRRAAYGLLGALLLLGPT